MCPDQLRLDEWAPGQKPARARKTDPESSHRAADQAEKRGVVAAQMRRVMEALRLHPGRTSLELSVVSGIDRYVCARRLPDLEKRGLVSRREFKQGVRWWPRIG